MTTKADAREQGRIILAHGEVTGHAHEVLVADTDTVPTMAQAQFFEGPDGTRELICLEPCRLRHGVIGQDGTADHHPIYLWPDGSVEARDKDTGAVMQARVPGVPTQARQGDVLLHPTGPGTWRVVRQEEWAGPDAWRPVAD